MTATRPDTAQPDSSRFDDALIGAGLLAGGANVIMQLSWPGVGYGVVESKVESGNVFKGPFKRTRTTLTYLAVATMGTEEEKKKYRLAVNKSHAQVRSTETSPVQYNAFDPQLQLWVAACLYKGFEDVYRYLVPGRMDDDTADRFYAAAAPLGTTLQVKPKMWPADRAAFEEYWTRSLEQVSIDGTVREYLYGIATVKFLPKLLYLPLRGINKFVTTGFLPPEFREQMRLPWSDRDQRRFEKLMHAHAVVIKRMPRALRQFPYNLCMWDLRRRLRTGRPLV